MSTGKYLSTSDFDFCVSHTKFSDVEILNWFKGFRKEVPNGHLSKSHLTNLFRKVFEDGNAQTFTNHIFRIFDKDNNGTIDFKEFMIATDMTSSGSPEEKLEWAFKVRTFTSTATSTILALFLVV